jgi:hypothetical protein
MDAVVQDAKRAPGMRDQNRQTKAEELRWQREALRYR